MDAVLSDWETAPVSDRLRAGLRLVEAMTLHPKDITRPFVDNLISDGLDVLGYSVGNDIGSDHRFVTAQLGHVE